MAIRPLTVVQMLPALEGGGVERGTLEVAAELVRRGHRSIVISAGGRLVEELEATGSRHCTLDVGRKSLGILARIRPLRRLLGEMKPDIVHVRSRLPAWICRFALRSVTDPPATITTVHGLYSVNRYSAIMTHAPGGAVIAVSDTVRAYLRANYPALDPALIRVIPRGVDEAEFPYGHSPSGTWLRTWEGQHPELCRARENDGGVLLLPGRLSRGKGHMLFLDLMQRVQAQRPNAYGLIVGGEDERHRSYITHLKQEIGRRKLNILMLGHRVDMRDVYAASDIVLSLSVKPESFGRTVLEALSIGTPVVGLDHGGVGEILADLLPSGRVAMQEQGLLERLTEKTLAFLKNPPPVPPQCRFLKSTMLMQTMALYEEIANRRRSSS